jgi:uncharacterized protein
MIDVILTLFSVVAAFLIGFLISRGGTCAVAAARDTLEGRGAGLFVGFAVASASAGLIAFPLRFSLGLGTDVTSTAIGVHLMLGTTLVAAGAILNDACLLGSLWRLGNGEVRLLLLPFGLAAGFWLARHFGLEAHVQSAPGNLRAQMSLVAFFGVILALALWIMRRRYGARMAGQLSLGGSMALLGMLGGVLFVLHPGWTYADVVHIVVEPTMDRLPLTITFALPAIMTILGAGVAARLAAQFRLVRVTGLTGLRTVIGGALMAFGAAMIPGGNDSLLLGSIPAGSGSAVLAYLMISLFVYLMLSALRVMRLETMIDLQERAAP